MSRLLTFRFHSVQSGSNQLTGTIPTEFGALQRLHQLYLHGNNLTGPIPSELQTLVVLHSATFHFNNLEGSVDSEVCELMYAEQLQEISADCAVSCECCNVGEPFAIP
jgi:hypothetical protein